METGYPFDKSKRNFAIRMRSSFIHIQFIQSRKAFVLVTYVYLTIEHSGISVVNVFQIDDDTCTC